MKKPQLLQLIQKGDRFTPAIYRFGANETLNIYRGNRVDICDARTGFVIRRIDYDWLRDWGYSPAKLLAGNTQDHFFDRNPKTPLREHVLNAGRATVFAVLISAAAILVSNITGCSDYVMQQLDKDIATSTVYPAANYDAQIKFKQANEHANRFLASNLSNAN